MEKHTSFYDELEYLLNSLPQEEFERKWELTKDYDVNGIGIGDFLESIQESWCFNTESPTLQGISFSNNLSPKYSSGFLFVLNFYRNGKSQLFN